MQNEGNMKTRSLATVFDNKLDDGGDIGIDRHRCNGGDQSRDHRGHKVAENSILKSGKFTTGDPKKVNISTI